MTPIELLTTAKVWVEDADHWTQGAFGRTADGKLTGIYRGVEVVSTCAMGALMLNCPSRGKDDGTFRTYSDAAQLLTAAASELGYHSVTALNDETDHPTVMDMFTLAIEGAEHDADAPPDIVPDGSRWHDTSAGEIKIKRGGHWEAVDPQPKVVEVGTAYDEES